jgi:hypothetical protein
MCLPSRCLAMGVHVTLLRRLHVADCFLLITYKRRKIAPCHATLQPYLYRFSTPDAELCIDRHISASLTANGSGWVSARAVWPPGLASYLIGGRSSWDRRRNSKISAAEVPYRFGLSSMFVEWYISEEFTNSDNVRCCFILVALFSHFSVPPFFSFFLLINFLLTVQVSVTATL